MKNRLLIISRMLIAVVLSSFVGASSAQVKNLPTKWDPPVLSNPVVIDLNNMQSWFHDYRVPNGRDVVIIGKRTGTWGRLSVHTPGNSNHCIFIGGKYTGKVRATGFLHTIYMEGLHIDNEGRVDDGIVASGAWIDGGENRGWGKPTVYLQNILVQGINGDSVLHGDIYQPQGRVKALRIYNMTGWTGHQGLQINEGSMHRHSVTRDGVGVWIERVNLRHMNHHQHATALYQWDRRKGYKTYLKNFWITEKPGTTFHDQSYWPSTRHGVAGWRPWENAIKFWSFSKHIGENRIYRGVPNGGDFVRNSDVGAGYINPSIQY